MVTDVHPGTVAPDRTAPADDYHVATAAGSETNIARAGLVNHAPVRDHESIGRTSVADEKVNRISPNGAVAGNNGGVVVSPRQIANVAPSVRQRTGRAPPIRQ